MKWLRAVSCEAVFDTIARDRIPGSCQWFLGCESYQAWKSADYVVDLPEVLWCYGGPGVGKTYLSTKIVEDLKATTSLPVCFFFASHGDERKREPLSLIGSWIYQLAVQRVSVFEKLKSSYNRRKDEEIITETELWDLFSFSIDDADRCYLVVDGFDELTNEYGQERQGRVGARDAFLRSLLGILSKEPKSPRVHLAITSRQETDIKRRISEAQDQELAIVHKHSIDSSDTAEDLLAFCRKLVDEAVGSVEEGFRQDLAQEMADRSNGMMLWPYLVSQELQPGRTKSQLLDDILESPRGLEHAYMRDLRRIEMMGPKARERAIEILRWTLFGLRPLSVSQVTCGLLVDTENMTFKESGIPSPLDEKYIEFQILGLCGSLLRYRRLTGHDEPEKGIVELAHFSVKEFLLGEANTSSIQFNEKDSHGQLAAACLTYFAWEGFDDDRFRDEHSLHSRDDAEVTEFYTHCIDETGFFYYCNLWPSHARASLSGTSNLWYPIIVFLQISDPDRYEHNWWAYFQQEQNPESVFRTKMVIFEGVIAAFVRRIKLMGFWRPSPGRGLPESVVLLASGFIHKGLGLVSRTALHRRAHDIMDLLWTFKVFWARVWLVAFISFLDSRRGRRRKSWPNAWLLVELARRPWLWPTVHGPSPLCSIALPLRVAATIVVHLALTLSSMEGIRWLIWSPRISNLTSSPSFRETTAGLFTHLFGESIQVAFEDSIRWSRLYVKQEFFSDHPDGVPFTIGDRIAFTLAAIWFQFLWLFDSALTLVYGREEPPKAWVEWK